MRVEKIELDRTGQFGKLFLDYISENKNLRSFYQSSPTIEGLTQQITKKQFSAEYRSTLHQALVSQYEGLNISESTQKNIELLKEPNTYTVTTGHQLNIFTGPLYFIYKIVSTINLAKRLKEENPDYNFVPVYWMASEDHDFEEIRITHIGDQDVIWECDDTGAVGRFDTSTLSEVVKTVPGQPEVFRSAYGQFDKLADSVRCYVNDLFGEYGIVVIEPDDQDLKRLFIPVIEDDLFDHTAEKLVSQEIENLHELGYTTQVNPREINFFYLTDTVRERIVRKESKFQVNNTEIEFSEAELRKALQENPERFSPNVIMRPLYQEWILPNIAYLGGPAEVIYWLEYKSMFDHFDIPLPVLLPRNFALFVDRPTNRKLTKTGLGIPDLFKPKHELEKEYLLSNSTKSIELSDQRKAINKILEDIRSQAGQVDSTLDQMSEAETKKISNRIDTIEKKMLRAEKKNQEVALQQFESLFSSLYPKGKIQERYLNFLTFFFDYPDLIQQFVDQFDPLDFRMNVLIQDEEE